jgi:hypothetical protein
MAAYQEKRIEQEWNAYVAKNYVRPSACTSLEQTRHHVREVCSKIEEMQARYRYVPPSAYILLARYNAQQNSMLLEDFISTYH